MTTDRRQILIAAAIVAVGLLGLDSLVIEPAVNGWRAQSARIAALRAKVDRGRQLCEREASLRERWAAMLRANLPEDASTAEGAISRWGNASQINLTSLTPQWQTREDGLQIYECRVSATGSQAALGRFLYELESDTSLPVNLEECELVTRDAKGALLTLTARLTFLRLKPSTTP